MRKLGSDTDFSPKTHVFYMKTQKKKTQEKLRKTQKNFKKNKKTQEGLLFLGFLVILLIVVIKWGFF